MLLPHDRSSALISSPFNTSLTSILSSPFPAPQTSLGFSIVQTTTTYLEWALNFRAPSQHLPPKVCFQNTDLMLLADSKIFRGHISLLSTCHVLFFFFSHAAPLPRMLFHPFSSMQILVLIEKPSPLRCFLGPPLAQPHSKANTLCSSHCPPPFSKAGYGRFVPACSPCLGAS